MRYSILCIGESVQRLVIVAMLAHWLCGAVMFAQAVPAGPLRMVSALPGGVAPPGGLGFVGPFGISISGDGRRVAFESTYPYDPQDTNGNVDIYLYDEMTQSIHLISRTISGSAGGGSTPVLSEDGTKILFAGIPGFMVIGETQMAVGPIIANLSNLTSPSMTSLTRRYDGTNSEWGVVPGSATPNLDWVLVTSADPITPPWQNEQPAPFFTNVYRIRVLDQYVERVSDYCGQGVVATARGISDSGNDILFESTCGSIVPGDFNAGLDAFVKDMTTGLVVCATRAPSPTGGIPTGGFGLRLSGSGSHVVVAVYLPPYLGSGTSATSGYLVVEVQSGAFRLVGSEFAFPGACEPGPINFDGSRVLVCGTRPSSLGGGRVVAVSDLTGGFFQVISRYSDGTLMDPGLHTFSMDWSEDERWVSAFGRETSSPPFSWPPAPMNAFRVDLGPGRNLGGHLAGSAGIPEFRVVEDPATPGVLLAVLRDTAPGAPLFFSLGTTISPFPLGSGVAFSWPPEAVYPYTSRPDGALVLSFTVPPMLPPGFFLVGQFGIADAGTPIGFALSNAAYFNGF